MSTLPDPLLGRLQRAVAPDYRVERRLGGGGMGYVYLAHDIRLNVDVAIKVLRPELDTEEGGEGFLREARTLASVRHPNVVVIHRVAEGEGLKFYFMELISGPTLEDRLAAGRRLPPDDVIRIGHHLLDALGVVHRLGLVHRDIKPGNIFVLPDRAVLSDFGITRPPSGEYGDAHSGEGTPDYKAPEQNELGTVTPRADLYSLGVVLYEAVSGRRFRPQGDRVDWTGMPFRLKRVLQRAVLKDPDRRWPDVGAFRQALRRPAVPPPGVKIAAGAALVVATLVAIKSCPAPSPSGGGPHVVFNGIEYVGPREYRSVADSLLRMVHRDLHPHLNLSDATPPALLVQARMMVTGNDVVVRLTGGIPASEFRATLERWPTLRDSVDYEVLLGVWAARSPLAPSLPRRALPRTAEGLARFLKAEQLVAEARWDEAHQAYLNAESTDSTCWICSWRITEIDRWLSQAPDRARIERVRAHAATLPDLYRRIIYAAQLPLRPRLDTLRVAAESARNEFLGWFQLGDELFHRGALVGRRRAEAIPAFERAVRLRPDFAPAWEHLAWVATAEGDSVEAAAALDSLRLRGDSLDAFSAGLRALLEVGFAWRFLPESAAVSRTRAIVSQPGTQHDPNLGAGPRMLPTFDVPRGAVALGQMLQLSTPLDLKRSGLIGQMLGALALGRLDDTWTHASTLGAVAPETELQVFVAELRGAIAILDSEAVPRVDALAALRPWVEGSDGAAWMSSLLGDRSGLRAGAPRELRLVITADSLARAGRPRAALALLDEMDVDGVAQRIDPFFRAIVHFRRADWYARSGASGDARDQLVWHEHLAVFGLPTQDPQAAEVDWAFGTLARWRLARLLEGNDACRAYAAVIRHWTAAPAPFGARADTARARARALSCRAG